MCTGKSQPFSSNYYQVQTGFDSYPMEEFPDPHARKGGEGEKRESQNKRMENLDNLRKIQEEVAMLKKFNIYVPLFILTIVAVFMSNSAEAKRGGEGGRGDGPIIYVTSQDLFYDSIVTADPLPFKGPFQELEMGGTTGLQTEFGPGDPGYYGGRWWLDLNLNGIMDEEDKFFLCPLLGPGRATP